MEFSWTDAGKIVTTLLVSVGGGGFIVWKFSSYLGDVWSKRLIQKELEEIKKSYELEFEKVKSKYLRYSENQFDLYNALWHSLMGLKITGDELWETASVTNLKRFSKQLIETKNQVLRNRLLIEEEHYNKLISLIRDFSEYQFGKERLIDLRLKKATTPEINIHLQEQLAIFLNEKVRKEYHILLEEIYKAFKEQIKNV